MANKYLAVAFKDGNAGKLALLTPKTFTMEQFEKELFMKGIALRWMDVSEKTPEEISAISLTDVISSKSEEVI